MIVLVKSIGLMTSNVSLCQLSHLYLQPDLYPKVQTHARAFGGQTISKPKPIPSANIASPTFKICPDSKHYTPSPLGHAQNKQPSIFPQITATNQSLCFYPSTYYGNFEHVRMFILVCISPEVPLALMIKLKPLQES